MLGFRGLVLLCRSLLIVWHAGKTRSVGDKRPLRALFKYCTSAVEPEVVGQWNNIRDAAAVNNVWFHVKKKVSARRCAQTETEHISNMWVLPLFVAQRSVPPEEFSSWMACVVTPSATAVNIMGLRIRRSTQHRQACKRNGERSDKNFTQNGSLRSSHQQGTPNRFKRQGHRTKSLPARQTNRLATQSCCETSSPAPPRIRGRMTRTSYAYGSRYHGQHSGRQRSSIRILRLQTFRTRKR